MRAIGESYGETVCMGVWIVWMGSVVSVHVMGWASTSNICDGDRDRISA